MDEKLILNDGTEIAGHLLETETRLFVYVYELTLAEAFEVLNEPEKTAKIEAEQYGQQKTVRGYNHLVSISEEAGGMVSASLRKLTGGR